MSSFFSWLTSPVFRKPAELELPLEPTLPGAEPADLEESAEAFVDRGMVLPDQYGVDIARAMVQDPFHLMAYWELRPSSLDSLVTLFPDGGSADFRPTMRLTDLTEGSEAYVHIPMMGKYWFVTSPSHQYRVDIGALSPQFGFVPVVRSNVVETPRGTVSTTLADDPQYRVETPQFVKLLEVTGFATDRVLSEVARADAHRSAGEPQRLATPGGPPAFLVEAFGKLPESVRHAAAGVAEGATITPSVVDTLPDQLRSVLGTFRGSADEELMTAAFMHLLPQLLRNLLDGGLLDEPGHPVHLPPRFSLGGSEVLHRPRVDWSWMPSMTESITKRRAPHLEPDALDPMTPE